jgi:hypothetical protein
MEHWTAVKWIRTYLRGTADLGLLYSKSNDSTKFPEYSDAGWGGDCNDHQITMNYH